MGAVCVSSGVLRKQSSRSGDTQDPLGESLYPPVHWASDPKRNLSSKLRLTWSPGVPHPRSQAGQSQGHPMEDGGVFAPVLGDADSGPTSCSPALSVCEPVWTWMADCGR